MPKRGVPGVWSTVKPGDVFKNKKSGRPYKVLEIAALQSSLSRQLEGMFLVIYQPVEDSDELGPRTYAREVKEFHEKFELLP